MYLGVSSPLPTSHFPFTWAKSGTTTEKKNIFTANLRYTMYAEQCFGFHPQPHSFVSFSSPMAINLFCGKYSGFVRFTFYPIFVYYTINTYTTQYVHIYVSLS